MQNLSSGLGSDFLDKWRKTACAKFIYEVQLPWDKNKNKNLINVKKKKRELTVRKFKLINDFWHQVKYKAFEPILIKIPVCDEKT